MSLEYAILGFLSYRSLSGYDLKKFFDSSVRHFWPADQSQIYRTLARLEENGQVRKEVVEQENRPDRKVYHITEAGREALSRWLATPLPPEDLRSAELVQVFFAGHLSDAQALEIFERGAAFLRQVLARYEQIPPIIDNYKEMVGSEREAFFWSLTLESGLFSAKAQLAWIESVIERIRSGKVPKV
jgi:PadR family transcriptional regulator AphA